MTQGADRSQQKSLNQALQAKDLPKVQAFLESGLDLSRFIYGPDPSWCPMCEAARADFLPGLEAVHRAGGKVDSRDLNGVTPLMVAAEFGHVEIGRWLLRHGANLSLQDRDETNAMSWAMTYRRHEFLEMVLQECPGSRDKEFIEAAKDMFMDKDVSMTRWLLQKGISPDLENSGGHSWIKIVQTDSDQRTKPLTEMLLAAGVNVNALDRSGSTALHKALERKVIPAFLRLLNAGADPDLRDKYGHSVRSLIKDLDPSTEIHAAFVAWDSSRAARRIIDAEAAEDLRPL